MHENMVSVAVFKKKKELLLVCHTVCVRVSDSCDEYRLIRGLVKCVNNYQIVCH